jgi:hypothetical protein
MILFIFAVIGLTHILVDSEIMAPVADWFETWLPAKVHHGIFECYQCSGFWCGAVLGSLMLGFSPVIAFVCGCAGSFLADFSESAFKYLESKNAS